MIPLLSRTVDVHQGRMPLLLVFLLVFCPISSTFKVTQTQWFCTDQDAVDKATDVNKALPSCLPGYAIDIEDVIYQSTADGTCSGALLCSLHNKNTLTFACNRKKTCNVDIRHFRFHINATCGSTVRFYTKYRCLPVIHEQKEYLCESPSARRPQLGDLNPSCTNYYRLHITMALIGISVKPQDSMMKSSFKCNKDTYWMCNHYIPDAYRNVCDNQVNRGVGEQCKIRYSDRPALRGCQYGSSSNFSIVEYSCIPGEGVTDDLPRIDVCSNEVAEHLPFDRGLLHSPFYPHPLGKHLSCKKQLHVRRESRIRLFMLEKSIEYYHEFNIRLLKTEPNIQRTLAKNEMLDTNITKDQMDEIVEIELKTNHLGGGNFLLYFQVDSRLSDYAPTVLENGRNDADAPRRGKTLVKRDWGIVIGSIVGLLLLLLLMAIVMIILRITKRRRARSLKYLNNQEDQRRHLNTSGHSTSKGIQIEHPHLLPAMIHSENLSDREALLQQGISTSLDNLYEEIKEHQQQQQREEMNFTLGKHPEMNSYLAPRSIDDTRSSQPIRDHRENEARSYRPAPLATPEQDKRRLGKSVCDAPMASTETLDVGLNANNGEQNKRPKQPPPKVPPPRMDLAHPQPSAPPFHLLQSDQQNQENPHAHQRIRQLQQWNQQNPRA